MKYVSLKLQVNQLSVCNSQFVNNECFFESTASWCPFATYLSLSCSSVVLSARIQCSFGGFVYFESKPQAKMQICSVLLSLQADGARRDEADKKEDLAVMDLKEQ